MNVHTMVSAFVVGSNQEAIRYEHVPGPEERFQFALGVLLFDTGVDMARIVNKSGRAVRLIRGAHWTYTPW